MYLKYPFYTGYCYFIVNIHCLDVQNHYTDYFIQVPNYVEFCFNNDQLRILLFYFFTDSLDLYINITDSIVGNFTQNSSTENVTLLFLLLSIYCVKRFTTYYFYQSKNHTLKLRYSNDDPYGKIN
ncbi:hypothetical protein KUTeg_011688 [Tegillarca granosa]|uniref:Uncharacterized protein n=1 Tax=Tegillarca granosa TaxID=220873 RepID=A0ABQ9F2P1_TEGGR|nr:hypothetical protein KUTeg_011688 [Tegillarca granosa]